jgi:uncharacterized protein (TIGR00369 family)
MTSMEHQPSPAVSNKLEDMPHIEPYLASSVEFYSANNIPIEQASWNAETSELTLEMETSEKNQGYKGVGHGGFTSILIDSLAGFAALIKMPDLEKIAVTREIRNLRFVRPMPIGVLIKATGKVVSVKADRISALAYIEEAESGKIIAQGSVEMSLIEQEKDTSI